MDFGSLRAVAGSLSRFPNDGKIQTRLRQLVAASATASNRLELAGNLLSWLSGSGHRASSQLHVALCVLPAIFEVETADSTAESLFMSWVKGRYLFGFQETPNKVLTPLAEIPGRLLWEGWEELLMEGFSDLPNQGLAQSFLNAMGKCCRPTPKVLEFLRGNSKAHILALREKACWALARLNSPGQPPEYRVNPEEALSLCSFALDRLEKSEKDPRTLLSLTACLFQGLSWTLRGATPSPEVTRRVQNLRITRLHAYPKLGHFQQIRNEVQKRIELLPSLLAPTHLTESEQEEVKGYLLEVAR